VVVVVVVMVIVIVVVLMTYSDIAILITRDELCLVGM